MAAKAKGKAKAKGRAEKKPAKANPEDRVPRPRVKERSELEPVDQRLMKALSHPLRVQILTLVNGRAWSPNEMSKELDEGLSQVSYHVKVLRDFEMIEMVKTEPRRGAVEHFYKAVERIIVPEGMAAELPKSSRLELLGKIIRDAERDIHEALKARTFYQRDDLHADWVPMDLDERGCKRLHARADEFLNDIIDIAGDSATAIAEGAEAIPLSVVLFGFVSDRPLGTKSPSDRRRG
jgi:DNA-binding transcriptional ArsR family regulator